MGCWNQSHKHWVKWGVLAAAFTGVMASFAPIVPYTFSLFLDPLHDAFSQNAANRLP